MAIQLGSNVLANSIRRNLERSGESASKASERLSSGLRINSASDDAAGLAISSGLNVSARIYGQAIRNLNDAASVLGIAGDAVSALRDELLRLKELSEQAANGTYSSVQRRALQKEADALSAEFNRIVQSTQYNGMSLLDDSARAIVLQAGVGTESALYLGPSTSLEHLVPSGTFSSPVATSIPQTPFDVVSGDVNNDGILDLATSVNGSSVFVELGNGDGSFKARAVLRSAGTTQRAVVLADFDNDGYLDVAEGGSTTSVYAFMGNGNGTFIAAHTLAITDTFEDLAAGDLNGDGNMDLAACMTGGGLAVLLGNGDGTFKPAVSYALNGALSLRAGDFNNDGLMDVASASATSASVLWGNSTNSFNLTSNNTYSGSNRLTGGDFDNDGDTDLAFTWHGYPVFLESKGDGTFQPAVTIANATLGLGVTGDVNDDGRLDYITTQTFFLGNGDGTFRAGSAFGASANYLTAGDFNNDGALDVISLNSVSYYRYFMAGELMSSKSLERIDLSTAESARSALGTLEIALNRVETTLGEIGTGTARIQVLAGLLDARRENLFAADSRIKDADIADEAARLAREAILQDVGAALLTQASTQPALALKLLV